MLLVELRGGGSAGLRQDPNTGIYGIGIQILGGAQSEQDVEDAGSLGFAELSSRREQGIGLQ